MKIKYLLIASVIAIKLPYAAGQSFVVVQGYNSLPTHILKDQYAMDLSQNGCDAYGKDAVAATDGVVLLADENGYNGGYGTQVLVATTLGGGTTVVVRYAHLIPGSIPLANGEAVVQGERIGAIGNTGLVAGAACPGHPGTHIHFAMYDRQADGSYTAHLAEPISAYTNITPGKWYVSDNNIELDASSNTTSVVGLTVPAGSVFALPASPVPAQSVASVATAVSSTQQLTTSGDNSSTQTNIQTDITTSTDSTVTPTATTTTTSTLASNATMIQPVDDSNSNGSWYSDNWYDLGTGFYGLVQSLTFEGFINNGLYAISRLLLDEYLDPGYSQLNQTYTISDNAPFTADLQKITIDGLSIPLRPNKYYRLRTTQGYQNRSVILAGTTATGTAMYDDFSYGIGRVESYYTFYPYLSAVMLPDYPPLAPPDPVASITTSFDSLNSVVNFSWPAANDQDVASGSLIYQINVSTSTRLDEGQWQTIGSTLSASTSVVFGDSYTIGVRATDGFGNTSTPFTTTWNFPPTYFVLPQQLDHSRLLNLAPSAEKIVFHPPVTVSSISFWVAPDPNGSGCCSESFVSVYQDNNGSMGAKIADSQPFNSGPPGSPSVEANYAFPSPLSLARGTYWFQVRSGPSPETNGTEIFGSGGDSYFEGTWSESPNQDAYFRIGQ